LTQEEVGLVPYCAVSNQQWPGKAAVVVSLVHVIRGPFKRKTLNGAVVSFIQPSLVAGEATSIEPQRISQNIGLGRSGSKIMGDGFKLTYAEGHEILSVEPLSEKLIRDLLGGSDLTGAKDQRPSRLVIDPGQLNEADIKRFPLIYSRLREQVLPSRSKINDEAKRKYWWRFAGSSAALYESIKGLSRCIACSRVTKHVMFQIVPTRSERGPVVFDESLVVISWDDFFHFGCLQSSLHSLWVGRWGSKMGNTQRYTPTEVLETFPFPLADVDENITTAAEKYFNYRQNILTSRDIGLTDLYNVFHDSNIDWEDIKIFRSLQVELDLAVVRSLGWSDIEATHGFFDVPYLPENDRARFTLSDAARTEVLQRLLDLNNRRVAIGVAEGNASATRGAAKRGRRQKAESSVPLSDLFSGDSA
jgi:hypothetical protein